MRDLRTHISLMLLAASLCACAPAATPTAEPTEAPTEEATTESTEAATTEPTDEPTVEATATKAATATPDFSSHPQVTEAGEGIELRRDFDSGGGVTRYIYDPITASSYVLDMGANIYGDDTEVDASGIPIPTYRNTDIGLKAALGMTVGPTGTLYVVGNESNGSQTRAIVRQGVLNEDGTRTWSTLVQTEFYKLSNTVFDHTYNGLVVSPDGKYLYIAAGSRTDHGEIESNNFIFPGAREEPLTSAIFRVPTDAHDLILPNNEAALRPYLFADGFRNAFDMAFNAEGDLIAIDNGPDSDFVDELNWIQQGHHYGFPWRFGDVDNPMQFPDFNPEDYLFIKNDAFTFYNDPEYPPPPPGIVFTDPILNWGPDADQYRDIEGNYHDASNEGDPLVGFTPHRSPLGLVFDTENTLPGRFKGKGFLLSWGAALGVFADGGQDLVMIDLTKVGDHYEMTTTQLVTGFANPIDAVLIDGKLWVMEFGGTGTFWEITFPED